jgi:hypothetical protein
VVPSQVEALPLNGRNWLELVSLVPGARGNPGQIGAGTAGNDASRYQMDGLSVTGQGTGGETQTYSHETVAEFQVVANRADAEYGRVTGAVINAVSKSGTNQLRGSALFTYATTSSTRRTSSPTACRHSMRSKVISRLAGRSSGTGRTSSSLPWKITLSSIFFAGSKKPLNITTSLDPFRTGSPLARCDRRFEGTKGAEVIREETTEENILRVFRARMARRSRRIDSRADIEEKRLRVFRARRPC